MSEQNKLFQKAFSLHKSGKLTEAGDLYTEILQSEPDNDEVWDLLGILYHKVNNYTEAELCIKKAISISPRLYYLENLARLYTDTDKFDKSIALYEDLIKIAPTYENFFNLAMAYKRSNRTDKAKEMYYKSLEINPDGYESHFNLAYISLYENKPEEAVKCYRKSLEIKPDDWEAKYFLSLAYMQTKDYENGLKCFESRLCRKSAIVSQEKLYPKQMKEKPIWQGEDLTGKTLFTYYEAGFGDILMFYRYIPILSGMCKKVIIKPQKELAPLFEENSYGAEIIEKFDYQKEIDFDYHIPFLSIPYVLGLKGDDVFKSHDCAYLKANPEKVKHYKENYCQTDKFKIGIKWQGNTHYDIERVLNIEDFIPLFELENTQFYSFQTFDGSEALDKVKDKYNIIDLGSTFSNFSDTAGAIENMDYIISNDSSLIHLAGGMNKPSAVLLPFVYNWRWHTDLSKCDWYDCVKIFAQTSPGDWEDVFKRVKTESVTRIGI